MKYFLWLLLSTLAAPTMACSLEGKWKSHKTKTLAELYGSRVSNDTKLKLARIYGKAILNYRGCTAMTESLNGYKTEYQYDLVRDSNSTVILKDHSNGELIVITLQGSCYKVPVKGMAFYEYFCRM